MVIYDSKLSDLLPINHCNNEIFLLSCFAMESWTWACFVHGRAESAKLTADIEAEIAEENSNTVLEKYVRLVAFTYTSPKVDMTASKLSPRKEKSGS